MRISLQAVPPRRAAILGAGAAFLVALAAPARAQEVMADETTCADLRDTVSLYKDVVALHFKTLDMSNEQLAGMLFENPASETSRSFIALLRETGTALDDLIVKGVTTCPWRDVSLTLENLRKLNQVYQGLAAGADFDWLHERQFPAEGVSSTMLRALSVLGRTLYVDAKGRNVSYCQADPGPQIHRLPGPGNRAYLEFLTTAGVTARDAANHRSSDTDVLSDHRLWELYWRKQDDMLKLYGMVIQVLARGAGNSLDKNDMLNRLMADARTADAEAMDHIALKHPGAMRNDISLVVTKVNAWNGLTPR